MFLDDVVPEAAFYIAEGLENCKNLEDPAAIETAIAEAGIAHLSSAMPTNLSPHTSHEHGQYGESQL